MVNSVAMSILVKLLLLYKELLNLSYYNWKHAQLVKETKTPVWVSSYNSTVEGLYM
jgi:hypothetical protein